MAAQCGWALARGTAAGAVCVPLGLGACRLLAGCGSAARRVAWALLLIPYLTPALMVGYAYSDFSLSLVHHPRLNQVLYNCVVWMKLVPVAAIVLYVAPAALSPEAVHCRRLLRRRESGPASALSYFGFLVRGPLLAWAVAFGLVFLLAFGEFETASLLGIRAWTVSLFDAHAGGLALAESLRRAALPMVLELALLLLMVLALLQGRGTRADTRRRPGGRSLRVLMWGYLVLAVLVVAVVPAVVVSGGMLQGFRTLLRDFVLAKDLAASLLFAGAAAACTHLAAGWVAGRALSAGRGRRAVGGTLWLCIPGLLGPLVLSLLIIFAFQAPGLRAAYDTPLPLVLALFLVLFPFALVLRLLVHGLSRGEGLHAAQLLASSVSGRVRCWSRRLVHELKTQRQFWVVFLLFCWGYFDLTASSILAPSDMTPVSVRLYNLMHYGRSSVLSAMVCVTFCVPIVFLALALGARRVVRRCVIHG